MTASIPLSMFLSDHDLITHEFTDIEFLSMLGTVLSAGDTLVVKTTGKKPCSREVHILIEKDNFKKLLKCVATAGKYLGGRWGGEGVSP